MLFRALVPILLAASALSASPALAGSNAVTQALANPARSADSRAMDEARNPAGVLDFADIRSGATVADYGAGGGYYSELLAEAVGPKGRVIALGSPAYYKAAVWDKLRAAHKNLVPVVADNLALAPRSVDLIFTHLVFHDLFLPGHDPQPVLANWFAAVKPGGHVIVADHRGLPGNTAAIAGKLHRIDPDAVKAAMVAAGFVLERESDLLHRSDDDLSVIVFDPQVRGKTDRFLLKFRRP